MISPEDIKLLESQRMTDTDDGGGYATSRKIVDGEVNNMFADISHLDRAAGRVSLREGFVHVDTDNVETYSGAHLILSQLAGDENIGVALFATGDMQNTRAEARDRLESYVTLGPPFIGWLWGTQPRGSRQLRLYQPVSSTFPDIGSTGRNRTCDTRIRSPIHFLYISIPCFFFFYLNILF